MMSHLTIWSEERIFKMNLNLRLKELRVEKKLTQSQVAKELNITRANYSRYECGLRTPPLEILWQIANFYNTTVDYLIGRTDY